MLRKEQELRRTLAEIDMNMAYRWSLGYSLNDELPHFSTVSYNFRRRYTEEMIEQVFRWILWEANQAGALTPERVFADAKEKHAMYYTQYHGLAQVSKWVRLKFAAMNLKKLALWRCRSLTLDHTILLFFRSFFLMDQNRAYAAA